MRIPALTNLGVAPVPETEEAARAAWPGRIPALLSDASGTLQLLLIVLGTLALIAVAWLQLVWIGVAIWALVAVTEWLATPADRPEIRLMDLIGARAPLRAALRSLPVLGMVLLVGAGPNLAGIGYLSAVLTVQLAWLAQPALATWVSRSAPALRYQPGATEQPEPFRAHAGVYSRAVGTPGMVVALEFVAVIGAASAATGTFSPGIGWTLLTAAVVGALGWLGWTATAARRTRAAQPGWASGLGFELEQLHPSFLVYVSLGARQSRYIVNQWIPPLEGLEQTGILTVREASQLRPINPTRHPVVYAPSQRDLEALTTPAIRAAFYLAYGERNGQLLRDPDLKHVMLAHGDSDKATSANAMAKVFDEIWVAGPMAMTRFRAAGVQLPADRFVFIGRPQAAELKSGATGNQIPVVFYAPTFEGYYSQTAHSSLDVFGVALVEKLLSRGDVRVWFRPHPSSGVSRPSMLAAIERINSLLRDTPGGHLVTGDRGLSLTDCLAAADVLVTDVSSVATEFLYTGRPIITCDPAGLKPEAFVAAHPTAVASYLLEPSLAGFDQVMDDALGPDSRRAQRLTLKKQVLGDPPGGPQAAFAANVTRIAG